MQVAEQILNLSLEKHKNTTLPHQTANTDSPVSLHLCQSVSVAHHSN